MNQVKEAVRELEKAIKVESEARNLELQQTIDQLQSELKDARQTIKEYRLISIVNEIKKTVKCCCDLDNWQPEKDTGHSWVCNIHKKALIKYGELY